VLVCSVLVCVAESSVLLLCLQNHITLQLYDDETLVRRRVVIGLHE